MTAAGLRGTGNDIWVATDGHGAVRLDNGKPVERHLRRYGGALRSITSSNIFVDAEEVVWLLPTKASAVTIGASGLKLSARSECGITWALHLAGICSPAPIQVCT